MKGFAKRMNQRLARLERAAVEAVNASAAKGAQIAREFAPVDSGELRGGIEVRETGGACASVISTAAHGIMVEYGTRYMAARSYMQPMAREMRDEFTKLARAALQEVFV